jgi:hypothetical protein
MVFRECSIGGKVYGGDSADDLTDTMPPKEEPEIKLVDRSISVSRIAKDPQVRLSL